MAKSWILSIYLAFNKRFKKIRRMHQTKATHRQLHSRSEQAHPLSHPTIRTNICIHTHTYANACIHTHTRTHFLFCIP